MASADWDKEFEQQEKSQTLTDKVKDLSIKPGEGGMKPGEGGTKPGEGGSVNGGGAGDTKDTKATESDDPAEIAAEASLLNKALHSKLVQVKQETQIEVQQKDPNSPLYSVKSFEELHLAEELLRGVYGMGFNYPSKIQETALPLLLADPPKNMIAQAQSGTGKTAAFVLTMLSRVDTKFKHPQCLCLAPTYELAVQTGLVVQSMGQFIPGLKIGYAVRGQAERVRRNQIVPEQIIIGTPGSMVDWVFRYKVIDPKKVKVFVLDEADVMISQQGHQDQSIRIRKTLPKTCQMMLFSATYEETVMKFALSVIHDPVTIRLKREEESLSNIKQYYVFTSSQDEKFEAVSNIYGGISIGQAIIFCRTKATASWLAKKMEEDGHAVAMLSGELTIDQRVNVLRRFKEGKEKLLITTNVMARGIDIEQVTLVINFDLPVTMNREPDFETYLHRIGRTGRFGKSGLAINFVDERSMPTLQAIEKHFGRKIDRLLADETDALEKIV